MREVREVRTVREVRVVAMKERLREESKSETEDQKRPRSPGEGPSGSKQEATKKAKILPDADRVTHHLRSYAHVMAENAPRPNASHRPVLAQAYDNDGAVSRCHPIFHFT